MGRFMGPKVESVNVRTARENNVDASGFPEPIVTMAENLMRISNNRLTRKEAMEFAIAANI